MCSRLLPFVTLTALLTAQDPVLPPLDEARPLGHPVVRGAARGFSVCVAVVGDGDDAVAATTAVNYLARLLESAGAGVAVVGSPTRGEPLARIAAGARAALVLELGVAAGDEGRVELPVSVPGRREAELLQRGLVGRLEAEGLCAQRGELAGDHEPWVTPHVRLWLGGLGPAPAHRAPVHELLFCMLDWWKEEGADATDLALEHAERRPRAGGARVNPLWPSERPPETEAEVAAYLANWRRSGPVHPTQVWLDVTVTKRDDGWELSGSTELPLLDRAVRNALDRVAVDIVRGGLRMLPDRERLGGEPFGVVTATAAQTWSKPGRATGMRRADPDGQGEETDLLRGEPVWLLDREAGTLLVHAASGYLGWVREEAVEVVAQTRFREVLASESPARGELVARRALSRLGTPYLYGGRSPSGIDCSGLVGTAWGSEEVFLPRDARTQILAGRLVGTSQHRLPLEPGDLLFFASSSGRIGHVGMSLGGMRFVHATPPEVTVGSLDPDDPFYTRVAERFVLAKRPGR